ncbi:MAG: precorrin-3B C(17)-methyltransferase [Anaerovoracaceae bacterium]
MKINVVGLGPGELKQATTRAMEALRESDVIIGYTVYIDLVKEQFSEKKLRSTPMKQEIERCKLAVEEALKGQIVSMVCSGDAGVYGMAGLVYQVAADYDPIEIEVISLSDLLTPWEKIEKRLACVAEADFAVCLYNPSSKKRHDYLQKACDILLQYKDEDTICGIAMNIGREGERGRILTLRELRTTQVDMFTTVFVGNSLTKNISGKMVTPRGYFMEGKENG